MPVPTSVYDTAEYVLNLSRAIANDAQLSIAGSILADTQPYTFTFLNSMYRDLQDELTDSGVETFAQEAILTQIVPVATPDPGIQVNINWTGYNNGTGNYDNPTLPADMVGPLRLWERQTGMVSDFVPMLPTSDGLPSTSQGSYLRWWEWRSDSIWMVGSVNEQDIRLRYNSWLPDLYDGTSEVLIVRSSNALAYMMVAAFAASRGSPISTNLRGQAAEYIAKLTGRTSRRKQRASHRRRPYGQAQGIGFGPYFGS